MRLYIIEVSYEGLACDEVFFFRSSAEKRKKLIISEDGFYQEDDLFVRELKFSWFGKRDK